jgi:hypothetical protein
VTGHQRAGSFVEDHPGGAGAAHWRLGSGPFSFKALVLFLQRQKAPREVVIHEGEVPPLMAVQASRIAWMAARS